MKLAALRSFASAAFCLFAHIVAHATPIDFSAASVAPITTAPASDTIALDAATGTLPGSGHYEFQTGNFYVGYSPIPDQTIAFSFLDTVTLNGITQQITISGENNVTAAVDFITIFAGTPVSFGDITFQLNQTISDSSGVDKNVPFSLSADISQTPEPSSLALLGTGTIALRDTFGAARTERPKVYFAASFRRNSFPSFVPQIRT